MNYIYDIFLNYNSLVYEMFEWNKEDKIFHIRKIPFIVINSFDLYNLINKKIIVNSNFLTKIYRKTEVFNKKIIVNSNFLTKIYRKTEVFNKKDTYYLDYCFLTTDKNEVVAFKMDKNGLIKEYSKLLVEEEIEVLNYSDSLSPQIIEYNIISDKKQMYFRTRNENKIKKFIYKELKLIQNDPDKINFLYLECFGKTENQNTLNMFYHQLEKNWEEIYIKVYNFLKMITVKR